MTIALFVITLVSSMVGGAVYYMWKHVLKTTRTNENNVIENKTLKGALDDELAARERDNIIAFDDDIAERVRTRHNKDTD